MLPLHERLGCLMELCCGVQESEASCRMLRELCLRSGVLVPPELMQSSSSLANSASMQVRGRTVTLLPHPEHCRDRHCALQLWRMTLQWMQASSLVMQRSSCLQ